jgi:molybdate transport system regulatory protein
MRNNMPTQPQTKTDDPSSAQLRIRLRVYQGSDIAFGPGKADLLEEIQKTGSISQAAKQLGMSYRRAWLLVSTMNHCFQQPLVTTQTGGNHGGGARISEMGVQVLALFRSMEHAAAKATAHQHSQISALMQISDQPNLDPLP